MLKPTHYMRKVNDCFCCNPLRPFRQFRVGSFVLRPEDLLFEDGEGNQSAAVHVVPDGEMSVESGVVPQGISELARVSRGPRSKSEILPGLLCSELD